MWKWETLGVVAAGIIQISAGVYLEASTASVWNVLGIWLTRQGSYDIVFAIRTALTESFNWSDYFVDKLISMPFTVLSVSAETWLDGDAENAFRRWTAKKVARKVGIVSARGVAVVCFGGALRTAKNAVMERFHDEFEAEIDRMLAHEFADLRGYIEDAFRCDPVNAAELISCSFSDVANKVNEDGDILERTVNTAVEFLPEIGLLFLSKTAARDLEERTVDLLKFVLVFTMSVFRSRFLARNFMRLLLEEAVTICRASEARRISQKPDPDVVEEFAARLQRRVRYFVATKVGEKLRRGLVQATAQSFILSGVANIADVAGL